MTIPTANPTLKHCDGCALVFINGRKCHEAGCPEAWKDKPVACRICGYEFLREVRFQSVCEDCADDQTREEE
jgi:hypothetical protein